MMTLAEVQAELAQLEAWPGWTMTARQDPWEGIIIRFVGTVPDAYHPGQMVDLGIDSHLPPTPHLPALWYWLQWRLCRIATHEAREMFRRNGRPLFDPHEETRVPDAYARLHAARTVAEAEEA